MTVLNCLTAACMGLFVLLSAGRASARSDEDPAPQVTVSLVEARAIALEAFPGEVTEEELESEAGGSGLRWSFDIRRGEITQEVGVDARTGTVLESTQEGRDPD